MKRRFHVLSIQQPKNHLPMDFRSEIEEMLELHNPDASLEEISTDYFTYSIGKDRDARFFRVPIERNRYGPLNFDFYNQVSINKGGERAMKIEPMLNNMIRQEKDENWLENLQAEADRRGILLLTQYNRKTHKSKPATSGEQKIEPLLPPNIAKRRG